MELVGSAGRVDDVAVWRWQRAHKRRTGHRIDLTINAADEMWQTISEIDPTAPRAHYLDSGARALDALTDALAGAAEPGGSLLDFACGYGRVTRHLVNRFGPITVSDIDPAAVDFVTSTYDLPGFVSVADPADLRHDGRHRTVWVASLFSHLSRDRWLGWLAALLGLVEPEGRLIVSVNDVAHLDGLGGLVEVESGFWFTGHNETSGRLGASDYGTTAVSEGWVDRAVGSVGARIATRMPDRLWGVQDLYVITR